uniref:Uncharacterized protein n=1 Tax=Amphimedon queenslandica TaxID=400682 RepID=A0A1X7SGF6_AMPQE
CKLTKKKHKTWEGDAILVTRGRSVTLKDMEGKENSLGVPFQVIRIAYNFLAVVNEILIR